MSDQQQNNNQDNLDSLYDETRHWDVNTGGQTIHAKRVGGFFRQIKWFTASVWLIFFLGPYLRWGDRQAVLFNIPDREFYIFGITILPQDVWMLALVLLFFSLLLAAITSLSGRVFCGFFCFQTVWTDIFTLIEEKLEGSPAQRHRLASLPFTFKKFRLKFIKHTIWILIGALTGVSFAAWFTDAYQLWSDLFALQAGFVAWLVVLLFTVGTYGFAGFMREQVCFWLCPYARIQGMMYDRETVLPTYDFHRGEPRGKIRKEIKQEENAGDCVDCNLCVAVCPTGIDIRHGQQEGCITCALCIDACDEVMDKVNRPKGLIRYLSLDELEGREVIPLMKRPRVLVYFGFVFLSVVGIIYGLLSLGALEVKAIHERQPLFVLLSDGSIQNKYELKILNKTDKKMNVVVDARGIGDIRIVGAEQGLTIESHALLAHTVFLRVQSDKLEGTSMPVEFVVRSKEVEEYQVVYESMFIGPMK